MPKASKGEKTARWKSTLWLLSALFLFLLSLKLLQGATRTLEFWFKDLLTDRNAVQTLGLGWLASYALLTGSPVAASALAFLDSGALSQVQAFTMLVGSRFGAIFVTVFLGFLYYWQGTHTKKSLAIGVLAYITTFSLASLSLILGLFLLGVTEFGFQMPFSMGQGLDAFFEPAVKWVIDTISPWLAFAAGLALLGLSLKIVDWALPDPRDHDHKVRKVLHSPLSMFLLGFFLTLISPSVTVSCGVLVPLYAKGYIRASRLVPYVMGANISTFSDTLLAALVLDNPQAVHIVMTEVISISCVALGILFLGFSVFENFMEHLAEYFTDSPRRLLIFLVFIFVVPLALLLV